MLRLDIRSASLIVNSNPQLSLLGFFNVHTERLSLRRTSTKGGGKEERTKTKLSLDSQIPSQTWETSFDVPIQGHRVWQLVISTRLVPHCQRWIGKEP